MTSLPKNFIIQVMSNQPKHSFHCILRRSFRWYHNWHNHSLHPDFHWLAFILIALTLTLFVLQANANISDSLEATVILAQQDSDPITGQPAPFQPQTPATVRNPQASQEFGQMVTNFFNYALILVGISVFIMIMWGGILWLTSAANPGNIATAKRKIFNAIIGAVILLSAYVILRTINPELVGSQFNLPGIGAPAPIQIPGQPPTGSIEACSLCSAYPGGRTAGGQAIECVGLYVNTNQPLNDSSQTCPFADVLVAQNLIRLRGLKTNWVISEGFPPTVNHADLCHGNGSCVDIILSPRPSDSLIIDELNSLCAAVRSAGFVTIVNEYSSLASSWPAGPTNCPPPRNTPFATGDHLHIER